MRADEPLLGATAVAVGAGSEGYVVDHTVRRRGGLLPAGPCDLGRSVTVANVGADAVADERRSNDR